MIGRGDAKKINLIVERTTIDIYEWWEDRENHIWRLCPPLASTHYHRSMGTSYRWEEDGKPKIIGDLYKGRFDR